MAWKFEFEGATYSERDLTIADAERIEELCATTWMFIAPTRSAKHARTILSVLVAASTGEAEDAVVERIKAMKVRDLLASIGHEEADDLPTMYVDGNPPPAADTSIST